MNKDPNAVFLQSIMTQIQNLEDMGGPELHDYIKILESVQADIEKRLVRARARVNTLTFIVRWEPEYDAGILGGMEEVNITLSNTDLDEETIESWRQFLKEQYDTNGVSTLEEYENQMARLRELEKRYMEEQ